jgi:hypothetical protein
MIGRTLLGALVLVCAGQAFAQDTTLSRGLVITKSTKLRPGTFVLPAPGDENGAASIVIRGNNLNIDFNGAVLRGSPSTADPDQRKGVGIQVIGNNVTIRNAKVHGYKVALIAKNATNLKILDSDFSYNWKQHLKSTQEREDLSDWMSYHQNEKDEWLRYGAGIYLRNCDGFEVRNTKIVGGQNALMITACNKGLVWNNDFSFNSSLGMCMYRSSENRVMHYKMEWNVRWFSYGAYNRGQDSAGILIYEQSNKNTFAYNSVTHGGDGFFLWAGQTTMDSGKGGCNDNVLYGNDWSHAPTNGIEATFSRNAFVNNLILECWHGIWGGYSYQSKVIGNVFGYNAEAIAWEHGQDNRVQGNQFYRDNEGIYAWFNDRPQDPNWGYPKTRDTKSHDWLIGRNRFEDIRTNALRFVNTQNVNILNNEFLNNGTLITVSGTTSGVKFGDNLVAGVGKGVDLPSGIQRTSDVNTRTGREPLPPVSSLNQGDVSDPKAYLRRFESVRWDPFAPIQPSISDQKAAGPDTADDLIQPFYVKPLQKGMNPFLPKGSLRGWRYIIVDDWGPYDFKRPLLWQREETGTNGTRRFEVLGPKGTWRVVSTKGATLSAQSGSVPGFVDVTFDPNKATNTDIVLEYTGAATTDVKGNTTPAGRPVRFGYNKFFAPIDWTVKIFPWTKSTNPSDAHATPDSAHVREVIAGKPVATAKTNKLDYSSGGSFLPGGPTDKFLTVAEGTFEIDPGTYTLDVTTDDGIRVWIDDKPVLESWHYQGPTPYSKQLKLGGKHRIRVEHFEIDGFAALQVSLKPTR